MTSCRGPLSKRGYRPAAVNLRLPIGLSRSSNATNRTAMWYTSMLYMSTHEQLEIGVEASTEEYLSQVNSSSYDVV